MSVSRNGPCLVSLVALVLNVHVVVSSDGLNPTVSGSADKLKQSPSLSLAAAAAVVNAPVFKPAAGSIFSLNLLSSFPEDLEISDYCRDLLNIFGQRYVAHVNCLVSAARPVKVCQNCFSSYDSFNDSYTNISDHVRTKHKVVFLVFFSLKRPPSFLNSTGLVFALLSHDHESCDVLDWWCQIWGNMNSSAWLPFNNRIRSTFFF